MNTARDLQDVTPGRIAMHDVARWSRQLLCGEPRGTALLATLGITLLLLPLGAFVVLRTRTHMLIERNLRRDVEAFYTAESGLEEAVAQIRPGTSFANLLAGPDGVAGTADDGSVPVVASAAALGIATSLRSQVRVAPELNGRVRIISEALDPRGPAKVLEALIDRAALPYTPAAVHLEGDPTTMTIGSEAFELSGLDHTLTDGSGAPTGLAAPVPALSTPLPSASALLDQRLQASGAQVSGAGVSTGVATATGLDLTAFLEAAGARPERLLYASVVADASLALGIPGAPQLSVISGDCEVPGHLSGSGILVVNGVLHVTGTLAFNGLLVTRGGIVFEPGSRVEVRGALWRGSGSDARLELRGAAAFLYSSAALAEVDAALPGILPRAAIVVGWREQL